MALFGDRLKQVMDEKGLKAADIAKATGVSAGAISKYLSDPKKEPLAIYVFKIAHFLNVSSEWLYGAIDKRKPFKEPELVDLYGKLSDFGKREVCDFTSFILDKESNKTEMQLTQVPELETKPKREILYLGKVAAGEGVANGDPLYDVISISDIPHGANYVLMVKGDSMDPLIKDGGIIFLRQQPEVENGEIAVVDIDGEVVCKKVYYADGILELRSVNPKYEPRYPKQARVLGKVLL